MSTATTDSRAVAPAAAPETADVQGGTYELLLNRLRTAAAELTRRAGALNDGRIAFFGSTQMTVTGAQRLRTANNTVPRDLVAVGDLTLFGYNVFVGLKAQTKVSDVFSLHSLSGTPGAHVLTELAADDPRNFLADPGFVGDFGDLYTFYKDASLLDLRVVSGKLLAAFRTGGTLADLKVFRWEVAPDDTVRYLDSRGDRDYPRPDRFDFEWTTAGRDDYVTGRFPHINIADEVFLDPRRGTLDLKAEDGTVTGRTVLSEPVEQPEQDLADCAVRYCRLGTLILLGVRPYREERERFYVYGTSTETAVRIDALGVTCRTLPEDHGIIFPGGCYLQDGTSKTFDLDAADMEFSLRRLSPNGEDVLYLFHRREEGAYLLLSYNLIRKEVANPILCHGASVFDDGTLIVFREDPAGPARTHTVQVWTSPFFSEEHAAAQPLDDSVYATIGNAELVRGISEALSVRRLVEQREPTMGTYENIVTAATRMLDGHHWFDDAALGALAEPVEQVRATAELVLDEFEKVQALRAQAAQALAAAQERVAALVREVGVPLPDAATHISGLARLRNEQGMLLTLTEVRYLDPTVLAELQEQVSATFGELADRTVTFLSTSQAFSPLHEAVRQAATRAEQVGKVADGTALRSELEDVAGQLSVLSEVVSGLDVADTTVRTAILEEVATVLGGLNRARALLDGRVQRLRTAESGAAFAAEFALLSQAVSAGLAAAGTPEQAEEQLGRLMVTLENLEGSFGDVAEHLDALTAKREEVYEAFSSRKQALLDERAEHAVRLSDAANRIVATVTRRAATLASADEVNAFFASDPMIVKLVRSAADLRGLGETVKADELDAKVKAARTEASRALRDRLDLFESGEVLRFGRHRFTVNTAPLQLTLAASRQGMELLLTGTDYRVPVTDPDFARTQRFWAQSLVSENAEVYRGEYLAASILDAADHGGSPTRAELQDALRRDALPALVTAQLAARYDEGYERGVHDADAAAVLGAVLRLSATAGLARFPAAARALAALYAASLEPAAEAELRARARSVTALRDALDAPAAVRALVEELAGSLTAFRDQQVPAAAVPAEPVDAAAYLVEELGGGTAGFLRTGDAAALQRDFTSQLAAAGSGQPFGALLTELASGRKGVELAAAWVQAFARGRPTAAAASEVVAELLTPGLQRYDSTAPLNAEVTGLLGSHPRITGGRLVLRLDEFLSRLGRFSREVVPAYRDYQRARHALLERERSRLRLQELEATVMSGFVRNRLIDQVYLPLIGDNLAKQIGAAGAARRTDQMGLLLIVSPPGYGKTTLMEYVTNRLGMVFVKVNGPALGRAVTSLDPAEAPDATSRREVERINFALQLGNNVMLYLDDIQHTNPELLQKFISLADATRRIEGVVDGEARTYDLRGKRFAVCMAGNPYTESGEKFVIPDMLANRADTYNLGDVLSGNEELFALSYVQNALTANPVLAPLAARDPADVPLLVRMAEGEPVEAAELSHPYSELELADITAVLRRLRQVQQLLLEVNAAYIASASQGNAYREEPPFLLQGSYRNMAKLAARVVPVMDDRELEDLLTDHYDSESQTLTSGAEENLLKLAQLRGVMTAEQERRWEQICSGYVRNRDVGDDTDPATKIARAISQVSDRLATVTVGSAQNGHGGSDDGLRSQLRSLSFAVAATAQTATVPQRDVLLKVAASIEQLAGSD